MACSCTERLGLDPLVRVQRASRSRSAGTSHRSERGLEVVEARQPAAGVDHDPHRVEPDLRGDRSSRPLDQVSPRHPADLAALAFVQRLPWSALAPRTRAARLDLGEDEGPTIEQDEVQLAEARAVVAVERAEAESCEVLLGEPLSEAAEVVAGIGWHARDAMSGRVTTQHGVRGFTRTAS